MVKRNRIIVIICMLILVLFILTASMCESGPRNVPVIIKDIPEMDLSDDMTLKEWMDGNVFLRAELLKYIKELIVQVKGKCNYIDLREKREEK